MRLFSRLLSRNTEKKSYVRRWLAQQGDQDEGDGFGLLVEMLDAASRFGMDNTAEQASRLEETARQYRGDATIFELACYTLYRLEIWLTGNQQDFTEKVLTPLAVWVREIFAVAWKKDEDDVGRLLAERLARYMELAKAEDNRGVRLELEERILRTGGDRTGDRSEGAPSWGDADRSFVEEGLDRYEEKHLPAVLEAVRTFCLSQKKPAQDNKKLLSPEEQSDREQKDLLFAVAMLEQKDYVKACRAFTKVLDVSPRNYNALLQRGKLYALLGQPLDAIGDFTRAIEVNPDDFQAYLERGGCYHRMLRQGDDALADYGKAIGLAPENPAGYFARGSLFLDIAASFEGQAAESGDPHKSEQAAKGFLAAIEEYGRAIALDPEFDEAYVSRGLVYARKSRMEGNAEAAAKAIADLERAMSLNWEHGYLYKTVDELKDLQEDSNIARTLTKV